MELAGSPDWPYHSRARMGQVPEDGATGIRESRMSNMAAAARRVMVVEDNNDNAELLRTFLQMDKHEVRVVNDGPAALELANVYQPDAVLLDVGLPGMDGLEVARRLRETRGKGLLLVALTGHARDEDRKQALASGFDHHFTKPLDLMALRQLLSK